jgi:hypothetical protein
VVPVPLGSAFGMAVRCYWECQDRRFSFIRHSFGKDTLSSNLWPTHRAWKTVRVVRLRLQRPRALPNAKVGIFARMILEHCCLVSESMEGRRSIPRQSLPLEGRLRVVRQPWMKPTAIVWTRMATVQFLCYSPFLCYEIRDLMNPIFIPSRIERSYQGFQVIHRISLNCQVGVECASANYLLSPLTTCGNSYKSKNLKSKTVHKPGQKSDKWNFGIYIWICLEQICALCSIGLIPS